MLLDVLSACLPLGTPLVVTDDRAGAELAVEIGAAVCADPGGGQGTAVAAALDRLGSGPALVVNADVPSVTSSDLRTLAAATPRHSIALVAAADGTTNALSLSSPSLFAPLYGQGSADHSASTFGRSAARPSGRRSRTSSATSTTSPTCDGSVSARDRGRRPPSPASGSPRERGRPLGRRRRRSLPPRPRRGDPAGRGRRDRRRRGRAWRLPVCTSRPTSTPSSTR